MRDDDNDDIGNNNKNNPSNFRSSIRIKNLQFVLQTHYSSLTLNFNKFRVLSNKSHTQIVQN